MQALSSCPNKCTVRCWLENYACSKELGPEMKGVNHFDVTYAVSAYD